jgi:steroid delta-isomerase-like uncharacterized protein
MKISAKRMAVLREHVRAESEHDMETLLAGMTSDCFNDVAGVPKPFIGLEQTAERYRKHWEGFPDFTVRVRRVLCADESCIVTENEWRGTHLGTFLGWPATGKPARMRAIVVWHFKGDELWDAPKSSSSPGIALRGWAWSSSSHSHCPARAADSPSARAVMS